MEQTEESGVLPYLEEKANYQQRHVNTEPAIMYLFEKDTSKGCLK